MKWILVAFSIFIFSACENIFQSAINDDVSFIQSLNKTSKKVKTSIGGKISTDNGITSIDLVVDIDKLDTITASIIAYHFIGIYKEVEKNTIYSLISVSDKRNSKYTKTYDYITLKKVHDKISIIEEIKNKSTLFSDSIEISQIELMNKILNEDSKELKFQTFTLFQNPETLQLFCSAYFYSNSKKIIFVFDVDSESEKFIENLKIKH
jgi:hypothetical protein